MDDLGAHYESEREHKRIPICIVEDHHHVVRFIHENIRKRFLPLEGNTLIHLDSHPDMLIPKNMPAQHAYESRLLYLTHDIENWIMPNCYTGIFQQLVWVKPPWANQIRNNHQKIYIGKCKETNTIRLECRENYFIAEGLFKLQSQLDDIRVITLDCIGLGNRLIQAGDDIGLIRSISENNDKTPTVLDIDLDFFSTQNPFLGIYDNADLYLRLKSLFRFIPPLSMSDNHIAESQQRRIQQLDELEKLFKYLEEFKQMPDFEGPQPSPIYVEVASIVEALGEFYTINEVDFDMIYAGGCTIDDHELPHHVSTQDEMKVMFQSFENFLDTFLEPPRLITISRSSRDDYTPQDQVEYIQRTVIEILNKKFICSPPYLEYLEHVEAQEQPAPPVEPIEEESMDPSSISSDMSESTISQLSSDESLKMDPEAGPSGVFGPAEEVCSPSDLPGPSTR